MCLAIPGKVKHIDGRTAIVGYPGEERKAMVGEEGVKIGDFVMVQMGIIVKILTPKEAEESLNAWGQL